MSIDWIRRAEHGGFGIQRDSQTKCPSNLPLSGVALKIFANDVALYFCWVLFFPESRYNATDGLRFLNVFYDKFIVLMRVQLEEAVCSTSDANYYAISL